MNTPHFGDWTTGEPALAYQRCGACDRRWYFERPFCPHCGAESPARLRAGGLATVYATTTVQRAPTPTLAARGPYAILLLDAAEGFRLMAHGDAALRIGEPARATYHEVEGRLLPYFVAAEAAGGPEPL